jgi:hypothetical protein
MEYYLMGINILSKAKEFFVRQLDLTKLINCLSYPQLYNPLLAFVIMKIIKITSLEVNNKKLILTKIPFHLVTNS